MATRTKKSGQRKAFAVGIAAFASVCLIATGFAAWVISAKAEKKETGNVDIGKVSSADVKIEVDQEDKTHTGVLTATNNFSFNPDKDDNSGRVRFDGTNAENRELHLSGKVGPQRFVTSFKIRLDIAKQEIKDGKKEWVADEAANARFKAAKDATYIGLPDCFGTDVELYGTSAYVEDTSPNKDNNAKATFNYDIAFTWGDKFGGQNPGRYYDENETGKAVSDADVSKTLNEFYKALTGVDPTTASGDATASENQTTVQDGQLNFLVTLTADTAQKAETEQKESSK